MRSPRSAISEIFDNPVLIGTLTILVVVVAVYLSYIAENGLPFIPTYDINVQVADGGELNKNVDVRIGGARVGQVLAITPEPASKTWPHPYAQLRLALDRSLEPLPMDTHYQVRLASVLGGQYVELFPGSNHHDTLPAGGTLTLNTNAKLNHNISYVDLSAAFDVFGPKTQQGIRSFSDDLGNAFAGRGTQLNDGIAQTRRLIGPLDSLLTLLAAPQTRLGPFVDSLASATSVLAPQAEALTTLFQNSAITAKALNVPALGETIDDLPATEATGTRVLSGSLPALRQIAAISVALRPAARYLPTAASGLESVLRAAPATLAQLAPASSVLDGTLAATRTLARDPAATEAFAVLGPNDIGTAGASAFVGIGAILNDVATAQYGCNAAGLWARNFASAISEGNSSGGWLRLAPVIDLGALEQPSGASPSSDLHIDTAPAEQIGQCDAGNEVYAGTQSFGAPAQTAGSSTADTTPPSGVYALGQKAGLVP